jgi:carboxylesterase type B
MNTIVKTRQGEVRGAVANSVLAFKGVPYAAPPFGVNRLRPPQRVAPWSGVRAALSYGPKTPQPPYPPAVESVWIAASHAHARNEDAGATYMYEFGWRSPRFDGRLGACHSLEIPPQELADSMHAAWVAFASRGDCDWPKYDLTRRATRRFDVTSAVVNDPRCAERALWARVR